jgi:diguanylate cyclase
MLPCVLISLLIGAMIGNSLANRAMVATMRREREKLVKALQVVMVSTEQLTKDVDVHNSELVSVRKTVRGMQTDGDLEQVQNQIMANISAVVEANRRMEDDLVVSRYQLQNQAIELDRTRVEARTDQLSGLSNRKCFDEALRFAVSSYKRRGASFALLLADVDHFKRINDTHGHQSGDKVVQRIGEMLAQTCRSHDHVARFGGDEFGIIITRVDEEKALLAAMRIREAVERTNFDVGVDNARIAVTFSMGLAFPHPTDGVDSIFQRADKALYQAKAQGRNRINVHPHTDTAVELQSAEAQFSVEMPTIVQ